MKKIYLAGPDVFRPDAVEYGNQLKSLCSAFGFEGLYPLDNQAPDGLSKQALARWICQANLELIRQADAVMANLNAFRGHEPDSGTVFETGFAIALGKPVWVYTNEKRPLLEQVAVAKEQGRHLDSQGFTVEDFGLNLNLMIACSANVVQGDARQCLQEMAAGLGSVSGRFFL
ncbi:MAG: nucleoside 2-deoxyribosyltransferase [Alcaligenaceae bacterium]|nr:nucleoside 2-deoxyribosyltransferase [Alcaligenaceae bacterium]